MLTVIVVYYIVALPCIYWRIFYMKFKLTFLILALATASNALAIDAPFHGGPYPPSHDSASPTNDEEVFTYDSGESDADIESRADKRLFPERRSENHTVNRATNSTNNSGGGDATHYDEQSLIETLRQKVSALEAEHLRDLATIGTL